MAKNSVWRHPKTGRLQTALGMCLPSVVGILEGVWCFCAEYTPDGRIGRYTSEDVERWMQWEQPGNSGTLFGHLEACGFLDRGEDGVLVIHDWADHRPERIAARERMRGARSNLCAVVQKCSEQFRTVPNSSEQFRTVPNSSEQQCDSNVTVTRQSRDNNAKPASAAITEPSTPCDDPNCKPPHKTHISQEREGIGRESSVESGSGVSGVCECVEDDEGESAERGEEGRYFLPGTPVSEPEPAWDFEEVWAEFKATYPPRSGAMGWAKGKEIFRRLLRDGVTPQALIQGAQRYRAWAKATDNLGLEFVAMVPTWLHGRLWEEDYKVASESPALQPSPPSPTNDPRDPAFWSSMYPERPAP